MELLQLKYFCDAAKSEFAGLDTIDLKALKDEPFVTMYKNTSQYKIGERICLEHGFSPRVAIQSDDPYFVRKWFSSVSASHSSRLYPGADSLPTR